MNSALLVDAAVFIALLGVSALVRSRFRHHYYSATSAMGMVMAIGIFAAYALPQLPFHSSLLARIVTLELLVIWLYLASAWNRHFRMHVAHPLRRFAIGTWVAGTAVLAMLVVRTLPEAVPLARGLVGIAVALYLLYMVLFLHGYYRLLRHPLQQNANGVILLATVSTQSVVTAFATVFETRFPDAMVTGLFAFDLAFLCAGLVLVALHFHAMRSSQLADEWKNANCIVHGAVSITGLGMLRISEFGAHVLLSVWGVALVLFVVIELLEFIRLVEREHRRGLFRGVLVYDTMQWTRNFTYGMFYAFSLALYHHQHSAVESAGTAHPWSMALRAIAEWGQYVVLAMLLIEAGIFLRSRLHLFRHVRAR